MYSLVLLSETLHSVSRQQSCNQTELAAWQLAMSVSDKHEAIHVGNTAAMLPYIGYGISKINVITTKKVLDALAIYIKEKAVDIIFTGAQAKGGLDTGMLPYLLADKLGISIIAAVITVEKTVNGLQVTQDLGKGKYRILSVKSPVILSMADSTQHTLMYSYYNTLQGEIKEINLANMLDVDVEPVNTQNRQTSYKKIAIKTKQTGHQRLQGVIGTKDVSGEIIQDGDVKYKAEIFIKYLKKYGIKL